MISCLLQSQEDMMREEISLVELFDILKKQAGLIINVTLIGLIIMTVYTFFIATPQYSSTTQLLVNRAHETETIQRSDIDANVQLINTYSDIIRGPVTLEPVREELGMDISAASLREQINVTTENNSQVFSVEVTHNNPYDAATIGNTVATVFQENLHEHMSVDNVSVISAAEANVNPVSPNTTLNLAIGIALGGMIGVALAFLIEFMDNTVKDESFIVNEIGWPSLGRVTEMTPEELESHGRQETPEPILNSRSTRSRV